VDERDVRASEGLVSMGIDDNWTFERAFRKIKRVPVHAYDGCTSTLYLLQVSQKALSARNWRWLARSLINVIDYHWFFSSRSQRHFRQFVGTSDYAYEQTGAPTVSLARVFNSMLEVGGAKVFLKIDIEGAEYEMLDEVVIRAATTTGLAIEFHDCDKRMEEIVSFVDRYPLTLVHVHANTYGGLGNGNVPCALELTFSSSAPRCEREPVLPHPLDAANNADPEIALNFVPMG
jgi:hypothetical protein